MITRILAIGIILLAVAWAGVATVRADDLNATTVIPTVTPTPTPQETVISDDIQPYFGPVGPDSPLYGLKTALEDLDEAFTFNTSEKVTKEMDHAELRIAEIKGLLLLNRSADAKRALDAYFDKMNLTDLDLSSIPVRTTGIANAYQQHVKHELALRDLLQANPNSTPLWRALNRTIDLEDRFANKSGERIEKLTGQLNRITARIVRTENRDQERGDRRSAAITSRPTYTPSPSPSQGQGTSDQGRGRDRHVGRDEGTTPFPTQTATPTPGEGSDRGKGDDNRGDHGKGHT